MIEFQTVTYKNLQSVGNQGISVDLNRSTTTLVGGKNGSGKSTLLEAIAYCLYGKPLKKVVLSGLINTVNKKNLLVEVVFTKMGKTYKVVRGQKPAVLEFYVDDELVDQSASSKDYQSKIEYVLGMDYKLFTQIVVLNKEKYVPFMELTAADRRKVVEDVLDISIFGIMADILKTETKNISNEKNDLVYDRTRLEERMTGQQRLITEAQSNVGDQIDLINQEIDDLSASLEAEDKNLLSIKESLKAFAEVESNIKTKTGKKREFEEVAYKFNNSISNLEQTVKFFTENINCPTCSQEIDETIKDEKHSECTTKISTTRKNASALAVEYKKVVDSLKELQDLQAEERKLKTEKVVSETALENLKKSIARKEQELEKLSVESKVDQFQAEYDKTKGEFDEKTDKLSTIVAEETIYAKCKELLKDDGIKASIVRDYIEFINNRLNEYLNAMEFYLNITIDENFNDKINSINREGFTYDNLSTGQKTRVNLAIWLALLEVASIKNSVVTNILFLDEILEPIDQDGVSLFMKLVNEKLGHKNVFVVTQRFQEFQDYFRSAIEFELVDGFTGIK